MSRSVILGGTIDGGQLRELRSVLAVAPDNVFALWFLGFVLIANHQPNEAIPLLEKAALVSDRSPGIIGGLVSAYSHAGRRANALRLVAELRKRKQTGLVPAAAFMNAYLGLGEYDQAFSWLEWSTSIKMGKATWLFCGFKVLTSC
jgi:predicted Zn-dependent protease